MRRHASLTAHLPPLSLSSLFQAAAGRAWARTAYHRTSLRTEGTESMVRTPAGGDDAGGGGRQVGPSSSSPSSAQTQTDTDTYTRPPVASPRVHAPRLGLGTAARDHSSDSASSSGRGRPALRGGPPTRRRVTFVDVESLSAHDWDCGLPRSAAPAWDGEPGWEEVRASVPGHLLPHAVPLRPKAEEAVASPFSHPQSLPHARPSTPAELVENLVHAITGPRPASVSEALGYHGGQAALHSTASFNLLIRYAIRCASFGTVALLLRRMVRARIPGDQLTRVLRVRAMVRSGHWRTAWHEESAVPDRIPLPVWLEFFGSVKRGAILRTPPTTPTDARARTTPVSLQSPDPMVTAARLDALLAHQPAVDEEAWQAVPPRAIHALVRTLLVLGRRAAAEELTGTYLRSLPRTLDARWRHGTLAVVHLHLGLGRARNLSAHFSALRTLFAFLDMHPALEPTAATLFFLLRTVGAAQRGGERADKLVGSFQRRWGPDVIDDRVRRRWASLWLRQGKPHRAERVIAFQSALDSERTAWRAEVELDATRAQQEAEKKRRARRLRWLNLSRAPRKGRERWWWRLLRRRVWRAQVRRRLEDARLQQPRAPGGGARCAAREEGARL